MILFFLAINPYFTNVPPKIDGNLEEIWFKARPITGFTQQSPDEGKPATESTEVYLLTDSENLYIAFRCFTNGRKPVVNIRGWDESSGDEVSLYLDTFGDKRTCYFFTVAASGTQEDGISLSGGISFDDSWDGVWFADAKITDYGYSVEMKIPFKAIRYSSNDWGIQFRREIPVNGETDYWKPVPEFPGFRISQFGVLSAIHPSQKGRFLEIYPVGFVRYNESLSGDAGLDVSYNPSSQFGFNMTVNPDFAQIEADPFQVNLSKYALYLGERRPFFLEGQEMFNVKRGNNLNIGPGPIKILYTRNIGKIVEDSLEVPIRVGLKFTTRGRGLEGAAMYVNTGAAGEEPIAHYIALKGAKLVFPGMVMGVTYSGKESNINHTRVITLDGNYITTFGNLISQVSYADSSGIGGPAGYLNYTYMSRKYGLNAYASYLNSNYNISEVGYTGMKGTQIGAIFLPLFSPRSGPVRLYGFGLGSGISREAKQPHYSKEIFSFLFVNTRNNYSANTSFSLNDTYEDTGGGEIHYKGENFHLELHGDFSRPIAVSMWGSLNCNFNYMAEHLGYQLFTGMYLGYKPMANLGIGVSVDYITYWKDSTSFIRMTDRSRIEDSYLTFSPSIGYHFTRKLELDIRGEIVYLRSIGKLYSYRINPVISYNFLPKSHLYLVYSKAVEFDSDMWEYTETDRGAEFKMRYLYYF